MRLLFLTNLYPPHGQGGYEEWCQEVATQLRQRGHEVLVLTSQHGDIDDGEDITWVRRELHLEMELASLRNGFQFFTARQQRTKDNFDTLRSYVRRFRPDAIMVWGMWNIVRSLPILAEKLLPSRVIYYMGDYWPTLPSQFEFYWKAPAQHWYTRLPKSALGVFARLILASETLPHPEFEQVIFPTIFLRNELVKRGVQPKESVVIYGAADTAPYVRSQLPGQMDEADGDLVKATIAATHEQTVSGTVREPIYAGGSRSADSASVDTDLADAGLENTPITAISAQPDTEDPAKNDVETVTLLWVGRLRSDKGTHTAIKALGRIVHDYGLTNVELLIAGSGEPDYETFLQYLVRKQRLRDHVRFLGQLDKSELPALYQQADLFLFTSVWQEPFGRVLIEAMAAGTAVIGSKVGGAAEILIENENSLTYEPNDDQELAAQIVRLMRLPELRQQLAQRGTEVALEQFDIQRMVQEIESYVERVIKRTDTQLISS